MTTKTPRAARKLSIRLVTLYHLALSLLLIVRIYEALEQRQHICSESRARSIECRGLGTGLRCPCTTSVCSVPLSDEMPAYLPPQHGDKLAAYPAPVSPIDTFTATWDRYGQLAAANTHEYINDAPGGCTWPLRRRTLGPMRDLSDESDGGDSEEDYYGDDEHENAQRADVTEDEDNVRQTFVDRIELISQSSDDSKTITGMQAQTDALSDASIEHWRDAHPSDWHGDRNEILTSSDFRICHTEEHDPYTLRMLYLRATAPGRRRRSSVVTVLRVDEKGRTWDIDENRRLAWLEREEFEENAGLTLRASNKIDVDGMTAEQLNECTETLSDGIGRRAGFQTMQLQHIKSILQLLGKATPKQNANVERTAPDPHTQKFRMKKKCTDAGTQGGCPKYKMAQYVRSLEVRLGQLSLRHKPTLEERLARLSLRNRPKKEDR